MLQTLLGYSAHLQLLFPRGQVLVVAVGPLDGVLLHALGDLPQELGLQHKEGRTDSEGWKRPELN